MCLCDVLHWLLVCMIFSCITDEVCAPSLPTPLKMQWPFLNWSGGGSKGGARGGLDLPLWRTILRSLSAEWHTLHISTHIRKARLHIVFQAYIVQLYLQTDLYFLFFVGDSHQRCDGQSLVRHLVWLDCIASEPYPSYEKIHCCRGTAINWSKSRSQIELQYTLHVRNFELFVGQHLRSQDKTSVKIHANLSFFLKGNCYISN